MQTDTPLTGDQVRRFVLEQRPVRGHWAHLDNAWRELRAHANYPAPVNELLGQAVAAAALLSATLKFNGTLTFQLQGNGAVKLLVAQCTHDFRLRAVARWDEEALGLLKTPEASGSLFRELVAEIADGPHRSESAQYITELEPAIQAAEAADRIADVTKKTLPGAPEAEALAKVRRRPRERPPRVPQAPRPEARAPPRRA